MEADGIARLFNRLASQGLRGTPTPENKKAVGREWFKALAPYDVPEEALGDWLCQNLRWWPTLPEVIAAMGDIELPKRKLDGCCSDGWVEWSSWPRLVFVPCRNCYPAASNAWAEDRSDWWDQ